MGESWPYLRRFLDNDLCSSPTTERFQWKKKFTQHEIINLQICNDAVNFFWFGAMRCGADVSSQALVLSTFYVLKDGHSFSKLVLVVDNPTEMCWRGFSSHLWVWQLRKPVPKSCWTNFTGNMLRLDYSLAEKLICIFLPWDGFLYESCSDYSLAEKLICILLPWDVFLYESEQRFVIKDSEEKMV